MALRDELLKSIWHAFTALDVDKSVKVSKSQLKVRFTEYFCETTCYLNISADQRFNSSEFPMNIQITCVFMGIKILKTRIVHFCLYRGWWFIMCERHKRVTRAYQVNQWLFIQIQSCLISGLNNE